MQQQTPFKAALLNTLKTLVAPTQQRTQPILSSHNNSPQGYSMAFPTALPDSPETPHNTDTASTIDTRRAHGQFYTTYNPFNLDPFHRWLKSIPDYKTTTILEPFAGANNIVQMVEDLGYTNHWDCFDIDPESQDDNSTAYPVIQRDTLSNYPTDYSIAITNPPYLAKNSASRRNLPFPTTHFEDLYQLALHTMLTHTPYVAAIIPESFITQNLFHNLLYAIISLPCKMFENTEVPVCLALFTPSTQQSTPNDFQLWSSNKLLGNYSTLKNLIVPSPHSLPWTFNDPQGHITLYAVDSQKGPTIRFALSSTEKNLPTIKHSSRSITRISSTVPSSLLPCLVKEANALLATMRSQTSDAFLTSFKGLRHDGQYRRRLDFAQARNILNTCAHPLLNPTT